MPPVAQPKRILVVAGARPNFVKIAPLMEQFAATRNRGASLSTLLVHTGQHYDAQMSRLFFEQMGIPRPDVNLEAGSGSHGQQTGEVLIRFEPVVREWNADVVVVVGDVNSTLACALVAAKLHIPVAHVEAGLRSFDRTMPEETNRVCTDAISDYLFVSEPSGAENLRREGIATAKIHLVGNVMIDSLRKFLPLAQQTPLPLELPPRFALVTLHRPSNVDEPEALERILRVLAEIGRDVPVIFPVHPRTRERIARFGLGHLAGAAPGQSGVGLCDPLGYLEFVRLESAAALVLTDSGGMQEETTALGVPCLTLRENTERPITVTEGTNTLVGSDPAVILREARAVLAGNSKAGRCPALWDGHAAERIAELLSKP
jgi:UDP-N-acetylglucosamine 2-epimerase (non-hydrolysing)